MATMSSCSTPVIWARLIRIDPPKPTDDVQEGNGVKSTLEQSKGAERKEGKILHHTIKSHDFPDGDVFSINSEAFKIGRANSCHLSIKYNKLVSGSHCILHKDSDGKVWIEDISTNGTLVNRTTKVLKNKIPLQNGDTIHLVFKNNAQTENVGFKFELIDDVIAQTVEYMDQTLPDEIETPEAKSAMKRGASPSYDESSIAKKKVHLDDTPDSDPPTGTTTNSEKDQADDDEIGETLLCIICQDIFHDCVSLQPCMHSFCAGCYSEWMATSSECPCCRLKVERISKNHLVNNLVESYLKKNPHKKRTDSDLKELDDKNKITHDMLYKRTARSYSGSGSSSPGSSDGSPTLTPPLPTIVNFNPALRQVVVPTFGPPRTVCRQCPNYAGRPGTTSACATACGGGGVSTCTDTPSSSAATAVTTATAATATATVTATASMGATAATTSTAATASTAATEATEATASTAATAATAATDDAKSNPQPPDYVCPPGQCHMLCLCCLQPMPDRRNDRIRGDLTIPQQHCTLCYRFYCHSYWTCPKADCLGCLGKFREMNFGRKCLTSILLENQFESGVLRDYMDSKGIGVRQLLDTCITKMDAGDYSCTDSNRGVLTGDTVVCYPCGLRNLRELAYLYRKDIDEADLPVAVTRRGDCYWGKGCRTQKHKPHHAAKLNHICDATRT